MPADLKHKIILITGASRGIGQATALAFAKQGCQLALTYCTDKKAGQKTVVQCQALGVKNILLHHLDIRDDQSIVELVEAVIKKFGQIDILVNNAGIVVWKPLIKQTKTEIENQLITNLAGQIKLTYCLLPHLKDGLINIASGAGMTGYADLTVYCAAKFGFRGFTQALAQEYPHLKIYCLNPGSTATRLTNFQGTPSAKVAEIIVNTALGSYPVISGGDINVWDHL